MFSGIQLLIPQGDIFSLEPSLDIVDIKKENSIGQVQQAGITWSLYALSADLDILTERPNEYHIAVLFKNTEPASGLLCEQISTIASKELIIQDIPTAMYSKDSPLLALAIYQNEIRFVSSAASLNTLFNSEEI
jgi:hypothetical protein